MLGCRPGSSTAGRRPTPHYTLRRAFFGYRRSDVLEALEHQRLQIERLAASLDRTWVDREHVREELRALQAEVDAAATARLAEAEAQAAAMRAAASRYFRDTSSRVEELLHTRDDLVEELGRLVSVSAQVLRERVA